MSHAPHNDDLHQILTGFGAYAVATAAELGASTLSLYLHSEQGEINFAFSVFHDCILAAFLTDEAHNAGLDAIFDGETIDATSELASTIPDDATIEDNMVAFIGQPLAELARNQGLDAMALYVGVSLAPDAPQLAFKYESGQLLAGHSENGAYSPAIYGVAPAGHQAIGDEPTDITEHVRARMGDDFPEWEGESLLTAVANSIDTTGIDQATLLKLLAPDSPDDPWARAEEGGSILLGAGGPDERTVELNRGARQSLELMRERFIAQFGREPGAGDPLFWDLDAEGPNPVPMPEEKIDAMYRLMGGEQGQLDREAMLEERGLVHRTGPKPGRNDLCPCGSGLKFKKCHGR